MNAGSAFLWISVVFLGLLTQKGFCCGNGWLRYDSKCYKIFSTERKTHALARIKCYEEEAELASLSSQNVYDFLHSHKENVVTGPVWIGLRLHWNGSLSWEDGTPEPGKTWIDAETIPHLPSIVELQTFTHNPTGCFVFNLGRVDATFCLSRYPMICEKNQTEERSNGHCVNETAFIGEVSGRCIFEASSIGTFEQKESLCGMSNAVFLDLDQLMREGLTAFHENQVFSNDGSKYWTALHVNGSDIFWSSGAELRTDIKILFYPGNGTCVTVSFNFSDALETHFYQTECSDKARVVCSTLVSGATTPATTTVIPEILQCPTGHTWKTGGGNNFCYWETSYETPRLAWSDARDFCRHFGGDLASFHSKTEEKLGLSFQYGAHPHPYWIGLKYDPETSTYQWSDGTPLDYENWAPGHPNDKNNTLQCVAMDAAQKHWISSLCGIVSWFVCKASKQRPSAVTPVVPTKQPLVTCGDRFQFFFNEHCYFLPTVKYSWHRAQEFCENNGAALASIHSIAEIGFLLRMLYEDESFSRYLWIGLNSLVSEGVFRWSDGTPVDFTFWDKEPKHFRNRKCSAMHHGNGSWFEEHCNLEQSFICKRINDTSQVTTSVASTSIPITGNCKKGWYPHEDRCYLFVGHRLKDRLNFTEAEESCDAQDSYLVSIRSHKEQAFLAYMLQDLKEDSWIGLQANLRDFVFSASYFWLDNSAYNFTMWAPGKPSHYLTQIHCVKMVYNNLNSGVWEDNICSLKLPYICQMAKDPKLPNPGYQRGNSCLHPEGWLRQDTQCFKMFFGNPLSWQEAETACEREGAHLISINGPSQQAVAAYLGVEVNTSFWIGLQYDKTTQQFWWLNRHPMTFSKWANNDVYLASQGKDEENGCFVSSSDGYWTNKTCSDVMPYICQITSEENPPEPKQYTGNCPNTSKYWSPSDGSYCYVIGGVSDWYTANQKCFMAGSELVSLHSMDDVKFLQKHVDPNIHSFFIGLRRNDKGGFSWTDHTPVNFVNWAEGQPESAIDRCVEAVSKDLKWKTAPCRSTKHYACAGKKDQEVLPPRKDKLQVDSPVEFSAVALTSISVCLTLGVLVIAVTVFYYKPLGKSKFRFVRWQQQSMSYENALYNVATATLDFQEECENNSHL